QRFGGFLDTQAAEESQLDDLALARVHTRQILEGGVERNEVGAALRRRYERLVERHVGRAAAALLVAPRSRMVDEDTAHEARCVCGSLRLGARPDRLIGSLLLALAGAHAHATAATTVSAGLDRRRLGHPDSRPSKG